MGVEASILRDTGGPSGRVLLCTAAGPPVQPLPTPSVSQTPEPTCFLFLSSLSTPVSCGPNRLKPVSSNRKASLSLDSSL